MRLGAYPCEIKKDTIASRAYRERLITERHRHRYEVNNEYREELEKAGLIVSGINPEKDLIEIIELSVKSGFGPNKKPHPFFLGAQFHPELKSRPLHPHPLFLSFIDAAIRS